MQTRIRFVVPTLGKNRAWLAQCLESIANQTIPVDLVVVAPENGSIEDLVKEFGGRLVKEAGSSLSEALNQGFRAYLPVSQEQSIEYFAWLGDDDVLAPGSLVRVLTAMDLDPECSFALGRVRYIDGEGRSKWVVRSGRWTVAYARIGQNFMGQPGSLIRKAHYELVGGVDESLRNSMDQDLFLKLSKVGRMTYVSAELASFRVHPGSISSTKGSADERKIVADRYRPAFRWYIDPLVRRAVTFSDRVLLSVMRRIPHPPAPVVRGAPYHSEEALGLFGRFE